MGEKIKLLTGGEIKLLFFSVISSLEKDIYIFDEPFASLDSNGKSYVIEVLRKLVSENKTIIITSHEEEFLNRFEEIHYISLDERLNL